MNDLCLAKANCKSAGAGYCNSACTLFMNIRYQIEMASIPRKHQKYSVSTLPDTFFGLSLFKQVASKIIEGINGGKGFYLFSPLTGTGKSTTACALATEYIIEKLKADLRTGERTPQLVKFVNVPDFLEDLRRGMNDNDAALKASELTETLKRVPLIILDDFGAEKISEWSRERLLTVISERYDNEKATIFTSNIGLQEVEVLLGKRIRSRIEGMCLPIEFKGKDWRRRV